MADELTEEFEQLKQKSRPPGGGQGEEGSGFFENAFIGPAKSTAAGIAHFVGLPGTLTDMIAGGDQSVLWSGEDYQQWMADQGLTYSTEDAPDTIASRTYEILGESAVPAGGIAAKVGKYGVAPTIELLSALTASTGGQTLKETTWGQKHPEWAQMIGELGGGLSGPSAAKGAAKLGMKVPGWPIKMGKYVYKKGKSLFQDTYQGPGAKSRATSRANELFDDPSGAINRMDEMAGGVEGDVLTPAQKTQSEGPLRLSKTAEKEYPKIARANKQQRSIANRKLKEKALRTGDPDDARAYFERELRDVADEAEQNLANIDQVDDPAKVSTQVIEKLQNKFDEARQIESKIWNNLPEGETGVPSNLLQRYKSELSNITKGGDIDEIDGFVRLKLGRKINKKGQVVGGEFLNPRSQTATAKELHQFYSRLGRKMRELTRQGGQANKIRILKELRQATLDDLDNLAVGDDYREALSFSQDLNQKFTEGQVGKMLGMSRGEPPAATMAMDDLLGKNGLRAKENIDQALKANPEIADDIQQFLKGRFAITTKNTANNRINTKAAKKFLDQYDRVLNEFPDLKNTLQNAMKSQAKVDDVLGVKGVDDLSPLVGQKSAAAMYLDSDPGLEMSRILGNKKVRTSTLKNLAQKAKQDPTRKAIRGLKNAFGQELIQYSKSGVIDELTGERFISGNRMIKRLNELKKPLISSGFMTEKEFNHFKKIASAFRGVEMDLGAQPLSGEMIEDVASKILRTPARIFAARVGGKFSSESAGGSIQTANIASGNADEFVKGLGKDQAKNILLSAVDDDAQMKMLLTDLTKLKPEQRATVWQKIIQKSKNVLGGAKEGVTGKFRQGSTATAVTPPLIKSAEIQKNKQEEQQLIDEFERLKKLNPGP